MISKNNMAILELYRIFTVADKDFFKVSIEDIYHNLDKHGYTKEDDDFILSFAICAKYLQDGKPIYIADNALCHKTTSKDSFEWAYFGNVEVRYILISYYSFRGKWRTVKRLCDRYKVSDDVRKRALDIAQTNVMVHTFSSDIPSKPRYFHIGYSNYDVSGLNEMIRMSLIISGFAKKLAVEIKTDQIKLSEEINVPVPTVEQLEKFK